jgi:histidinol phosphatase-like enzyme (inositol monophosphatase family)
MGIEMEPAAKQRAATVACEAADAARREILPRFRSVSVETKADGSPVTEADLAAEQAIRRILREAYPEAELLGEEFGAEAPQQAREANETSSGGGRLAWIVDPIDGTLAFSRGIPLFSTLIALLEDGEPVVGLIDLPALDERYVGWKGGDCRRNGEVVRVSHRSDLKRAIVSHGDPFCFDRAGQRPAFERMAREIPFLRGYTDAFGHALVLGGGVDVMVDLDLSPWDAAASQVLVRAAGGECATLSAPNGKLGLVLGSPPLVRELSSWLDPRDGWLDPRDGWLDPRDGWLDPQDGWLDPRDS